jgi:hypothetical protein
MPPREQSHHGREPSAWHRISEHHLVRSRHGFGAPFGEPSGAPRPAGGAPTQKAGTWQAFNYVTL